MIRTTALIVTLSLLAGCSTGSSLPPVSAIPTTAAACEAMRAAFPVKELDYDSDHDTPATVADIKADNRRKQSMNARFASACP